MFLSRNKKNNVYPCKPQFYYIKVGFNGVNIIKACFRDELDALCIAIKGSKVSLFHERRLYPDCTDAQVNLSLHWAHMSEGKFSHVMVLMYLACPENDN